MQSMQGRSIYEVDELPILYMSLDYLKDIA